MGKERIEAALQNVLNQGDKAFVPYIMAGDDGLETLESKLNFLQNHGATLIELGVPFSDPVADGPTIQAAGIRSLSAGTTLEKILDRLKTIRNDIHVPIVLMTYINPLLQFGIERLAKEASEAGVDGFIIPDVPFEEEGIIAPLLKDAGIALIQLVTITSPIQRIEKIVNHSEGFVYAVTVAGITGARKSLQSSLHQYLQTVKKLSPIPVLAGFGISTPEQVRDTTQYCDGVVAGSKVIELFQEGKHEELISLMKASQKMKK
ncbi:tryptophan synthase alpha chain [Bacillus oleivorans]|uniref:Tryptophan synthase alpha chain n=1 Tax=Bacillus oleivorans TaxID=1448271 RepID=A0A285CLI5_9BACI|nr:tryptophan synthase subunit alpha [Bacillus oleivorans]SNX68419.1 tryptophan synthase alpha chain [Bacillus oleivorans]